MYEINPSIHPFRWDASWLSHCGIRLNGKIAERIYCEIKINRKSTICLRLSVAGLMQHTAQPNIALIFTSISVWAERVRFSWNMNLWSSIRGWSHYMHTHSNPFNVFFVFFLPHSHSHFIRFLKARIFLEKTVDEKSVELPFGKMKYTYAAVYASDIWMLNAIVFGVLCCVFFSLNENVYFFWSFKMFCNIISTDYCLTGTKKTLKTYFQRIESASSIYRCFPCILTCIITYLSHISHVQQRLM